MKRMLWTGRMALATTLALVLPALPASEDHSEEYLRDLAELHTMLRESPSGEARDMSNFALDIQVMDLERIVITDRLGRSDVYHYVIYRLRNRVNFSGAEEMSYSNSYNEVLAQIAAEYQDVEIAGNALKVVTEYEQDSDLNTILDRSDLVNNSRSVQIMVSAFDEDGTRLNTLDDIHHGSQDRFSFEDRGRRAVAVGYREIRKRIEERVRRRLHLASEIAGLELKPYDAGRKDAEGVAQGEIWGVAIFERIDPHGDRITLQFRGLSNASRLMVPVHQRHEVADYYNTRVLRRMYEVVFRRSGDEYSRDLDPFERISEGWEWDDTFQRLSLRRQIAAAVYFLDNIADARNRPDPAVEEQFLDHYQAQQSRFEQLPDLGIDPSDIK